MTLIWGSTFVLIKKALNDSSLLLLNAVRMALAAVLLAFYYRKHLATMTRQALISGVVVGVFLYLGYALQTTGLNLTTPSKAAFLTGTSTVLVPVLLVVFWRARLHPWRAAGIVLAFLGLFLMIVPAGREGLADFARINRGDVLSIGCALAFAFQIILLGRASQRFPFEHIAVLQMATAATFMAATTPILEHPRFDPSPTVIGTVVVSGILGTRGPFPRPGWGQQIHPGPHPGVFFHMEPVFCLVTSFIYLKERLGLRAGAGALLILSGVM